MTLSLEDLCSFAYPHRFETAQTQIAELRFKNNKLEEILQKAGGTNTDNVLKDKVKELEESLKQYKTLKNYNELIAEKEFQAKIMETETDKDNSIMALSLEIEKLKNENEQIKKDLGCEAEVGCIFDFNVNIQ